MVGRVIKGMRQKTLPPRDQLWQLPICYDEGTVSRHYRALERRRLAGWNAAWPVNTAAPPAIRRPDLRAAQDPAGHCPRPRHPALAPGRPVAHRRGHQAGRHLRRPTGRAGPRTHPARLRRRVPAVGAGQDPGGRLGRRAARPERDPAVLQGRPTRRGQHRPPTHIIPSPTRLPPTAPSWPWWKPTCMLSGAGASSNLPARSARQHRPVRDRNHEYWRGR